MNMKYEHNILNRNDKFLVPLIGAQRCDEVQCKHSSHELKLCVAVELL